MADDPNDRLSIKFGGFEASLFGRFSICFAIVMMSALVIIMKWQGWL